jgi:hypothetical protein
MFVLSRDRQSPDHNEHKEQKKRERQRQEKEKRETEMKKKFKVMFLSFNPLVYQLSFRLGVQVFSTSVTF